MKLDELEKAQTELGKACVFYIIGDCEGSWEKRKKCFSGGYNTCGEYMDNMLFYTNLFLKERLTLEEK